MTVNNARFRLMIKGFRVSEIARMPENIISIKNRLRVSEAITECSTSGKHAKKRTNEIKSTRKRLFFCKKIIYSHGCLCICLSFKTEFTMREII